MAITSAWCSVLQASIPRLTTLEGEVSTVVCPEFEPVTRTCRLKKAVGRGGPLSQLLERVSEQALRSPAPRCNLA
jgi:hypothetical protein